MGDRTLYYLMYIFEFPAEQQHKDSLISFFYNVVAHS